jgi:hypothetical protein
MGLPGEDLPDGQEAKAHIKFEANSRCLVSRR